MKAEIYVCPVCGEYAEDDYELGAMCFGHSETHGAVDCVPLEVEYDPSELIAEHAEAMAQLAAARKEQKNKRKAEQERRAAMTQKERDAEDKAAYDALSPMGQMIYTLETAYREELGAQVRRIPWSELTSENDSH